MEKVMVLNKIVGVMQFVVALFYLDLNDWNKIGVSILLCLGGMMMLMVGSKTPSVQTAHKVLCYVSIVAAAGLVVKVLFAS